MDWSMWNVPWIPYGIVHGFAIEIHWKFHGIHGGYGLIKWLGTQPKNSPYEIHGLGDGIHPVHMESIWNYPGSVKTLSTSTPCHLALHLVVWPAGLLFGLLSHCFPLLAVIWWPCHHLAIQVAVCILSWLLDCG
jgi:hypothetical protein